MYIVHMVFHLIHKVMHLLGVFGVIYVEKEVSSFDIRFNYE